MDKTALRQITDAIERSKTIGIVTTKDPSVDEMAAALALYLTLDANGKQASIASPETPLVELSSLVGIDRVQTSLSGKAGDLIVSFPYREGEIDKVSYTLENDMLNIVVKAGQKGLTFSENQVRFTRPQGAPDLLVTVGVPRLSDIAKIFDVAELKDTTIINIDNRPENQGFGDIVLVYPMLSSISEQVTNLILSLNYQMDIDVAQNLMYGISGATNNFQNPKTSAIAFEMASVLMKNGAIRVGGVQQEPVNIDQFSPQPTPRKQSARQENLPQRQPVPQNQTQHPQQNKNTEDNNPPEDWLAPKIYKGSTNF